MKEVAGLLRPSCQLSTNEQSSTWDTCCSACSGIPQRLNRVPRFPDDTRTQNPSEFGHGLERKAGRQEQAAAPEFVISVLGLLGLVGLG